MRKQILITPLLSRFSVRECRNDCYNYKIFDSMKSIYSILLAGVALVAVASCGNRGKKAEVVEAVVEEVSEVRIYSTAYDGYTNVRQSPSSKSKVLGKLRNGNEYVVLVGMEGNWYEVEYYDQIGYVHKDHVGDTPSEPVTVDVDANWLNGCWFDKDYAYQEGYVFYLIYSNGKFTKEHEYDYGTMCHGRWHLEGDEIVLTSVYVTEGGKKTGIERGDVERFKINKSSRKLGRMTKLNMAAENADISAEDASMMNKNGFNFLKKEADKYVKNITNPIIELPNSQGTGNEQVERVSEPSNNNEERAQKKGKSEDWDAVLTSYEEYVDKYITFAKKAVKGDVKALAKYPALMQKAEELSNKLEKAEDEMSSAQVARYTKISMKLAKAAEELAE